MEPEGSLPHSQVPATCPNLSRQSRFEALSVNISLQCMFLRWGAVSTSPKPQAGGPTLVGCPRLLIQYIRSYPPYWRPFLHPQPEEVADNTAFDLSYYITAVSWSIAYSNSELNYEIINTSARLCIDSLDVVTGSFLCLQRTTVKKKKQTDTTPPCWKWHLYILLQCLSCQTQYVHYTGGTKWINCV